MISISTTLSAPLKVELRENIAVIHWAGEVMSGVPFATIVVMSPQPLPGELSGFKKL
jgi:hypothetical protein